MPTRKELKTQYKQAKKEAGIYAIKNTQNGRQLVVSTPDLKTINGKRFSLDQGSHMNKTLQAEWIQFGAAAFEFEVLEILKEPEDGEFFDRMDELKTLEKKWLAKLQPFGEKGYN
jgi:hypothetical protein